MTAPRRLSPNGRVPQPEPLPPHDTAAEEAVIAALLLDGSVVAAVRAIVRPEDFFREQNAWIYEACLALADRGDPITLPLLAHELERGGRLDDVGGEPALVEITGRYFTAIGVEAHARIVARDALYRSTIRVAQQITQIAYAGSSGSERLIGRVDALVASLHEAEGRLAQQAEPAPATEVSYRYQPLLPPDHFVSRWTDYVGSLTDAPPEYSEACGLAMLGTMVPTLRIAKIGGGLDDSPLCLYLLLIGHARRSRKSTVVDYMRRIVSQLLPTAVLDDEMSPEGFQEALGMRQGRSSVWLPDEFAEHLRSTSAKAYMADFNSTLLKAYNGRTITKMRHSKRIKGGGSEADVDVIYSPRLTVVAASTPTVLEHISWEHLSGGLIPRFVIVWPDRLPPAARPPARTDAHDRAEREIKDYLATLRDWAIAGTRPDVLIEDEAVDLWFETTKAYGDGSAAIAGIPTAALRASVLVALGDEIPAPQTRRVVVEAAHVEAALRIAERWVQPAVRLEAEMVGDESPTARSQRLQFERVREIVERDGSVSQAVVTREITRSAAATAQLRASLTDAGIITVQESRGRGRPRAEWYRAT